MRRLGVTVVVPTYNSKHLLLLTLDSLCKQDMDRSLFEVIVVDDGSTDGSSEVIPLYRKYIDVRYFFQDDLGFRAAAARNVGIRNAKFDVTLFIDAGILLSPRLLTMHDARHRGAKSLALIGLSYGVQEHDNVCADLISGLVSGGVDAALESMRALPELQDCREKYLQSINRDLSRMRSPWLIFWSGHVSVSTVALRRIGGFDEWFRTWGGEDVELGLRLFASGCALEILPGVQSIHYPHYKDPDQKVRDSAANAAYIHKKHRLKDTESLMSCGWESIALSADTGSCQQARSVLTMHPKDRAPLQGCL